MGLVKTKSPKKPATLKDIAQEAGVSAMAVSNVLRGRGRVSEETRHRILLAAERLNYIPNQVAQSLRRAKTNTIGVVMADSSQYVLNNLLKSIERTAAQHDYSVILANTLRNRESETKAVDLLMSKRIDGLLLAAPIATTEEDIDHLNSLGIPFVLLMRTSLNSGVSYVVNDNISGGYLAMKHICEGSHSPVFFIALDSESGREREAGCRKRADELGVKICDDLIFRTGPTIESGYNVMRDILAKGISHGTICCGCDMMAVGAMNAIFEAGLSIPGDFCLIGYDDFDFAKYLRVPLTTIHQPINEIGEEGFKLLHEHISTHDTPPRSVVLPPTLIVRESTIHAI